MSTRILPTATDKPIRVVSYIRMSSGKQEDSPDRQRNAINVYAKSKGYTLGEEYSDLGISGWKDEGRPGFRRLLADARAGKFDVILLDQDSRLARLYGFKFIATVAYPLLEAGVSVETAQSGPLDWDNIGGQVLTLVKSDKASEEIRDLSWRVLGGMKEAAEAGGWMGSTPIGYTLVTDPETKKNRLELGAPEVVKAIRWAFETYATGTMGLVRVAAGLADRGVVSAKTGKPLSQAGLGYVFRNPAYVGDIAWNRRTSGRFHRLKGGAVKAKSKGVTEKNATEDWVLIQNAHTPIVSRELFESVQRRLSGNKGWTTPIPGGGDFRLTKLLVCGRCGAFMYGSHQYETVVYRCGTYAQRGTKGCDANTIHETPLLRAIAGRLQEGLINPETVATLRAEVARQESQMADPATRTALAKRAAELTEQIARDEARLLELPSDVVGGAVEVIRRRKAERDGVAAEIAKIDAQVKPSLDLERAVEEITGRVHRLRDVVLNGNPADVRAALRSIITKVVLHFDRKPPTHAKGRTQITFRGGDIYVIPPESSDSKSPECW